jgi:hypothetical protein
MTPALARAIVAEPGLRRVYRPDPRDLLDSVGGDERVDQDRQTI